MHLSTNKFEILSSPPQFPASSRAIRANHPPGNPPTVAASSGAVRTVLEHQADRRQTGIGNVWRFCIALRTALQEAVLGGDVGDEVRQTRGWKLFLLLLRMLLSKDGRDDRERQVGEAISIISCSDSASSVGRVGSTIRRRSRRR